MDDNVATPDMLLLEMEVGTDQRIEPAVYWEAPLHSAHYPIRQMKDDVVVVGANVA